MTDDLTADDLFPVDVKMNLAAKRAREALRQQDPYRVPFCNCPEPDGYSLCPGIWRDAFCSGIYSPPPQPGTVTADNCGETTIGSGEVWMVCDEDEGHGGPHKDGGFTWPQPGTVTLPASVVRALLPESQDESHEAALVARRALAEVEKS